jgi:ATP-dependent Clp protease ATP-binding subunit ClpC
VERFLEDPLAEEILRGHIKEGDTVTISAEKTKLTFKVPETAQPAEAGGLVDS